MSYTHLSTCERGRLESSQKLGWSTREIAKELNRHQSTIARELKRNQVKNSYDSQFIRNVANVQSPRENGQAHWLQ